MLVALHDGQRTEATSAQRNDGYTCPNCKGPVVLKRGRIVIAHFAHKPPVSCDWAAGETLAHLEAKHLFAALFRGRGRRVEIEYTIPAVPSFRRADVVVWSRRDHPVVVELQHTNIGIEEIEMRAFAYAKAGFVQTWIPFLRPDIWDSAQQLEDDDRGRSQYLIKRYAARPFERWIHGFNCGHIMYYDPRLKALWSGSFEGHLISGGGDTWYDSDGNENYSAPYARWSRRWRELALTGPFELADIFFKPKPRTAYSVGPHRWPAGGYVETHVRVKRAATTADSDE